ncbi:MAG TPA: hypothetical protein VF062_13810 [Candidatus Limnocylindrales bacterium]
MAQARVGIPSLWVSSGAVMPEVCARHGRPATVRVNATLSARPPWWVYLLLGIFGALGGLIIGLVMARMRQAVLAAGWPFCARCRIRRAVALAVGLAILATGAGLFVLAIARFEVATRPIGLEWIVYGLAAFVAGGLITVQASWQSLAGVVVPRDAGLVVVRRAHERFAARAAELAEAERERSRSRSLLPHWTSLDEPVLSPEELAATRPRARTRAPGKRFYISAGVVLAVVGAILAINPVHRELFPPQDAISSFYAALTARDGVTARKFLAGPRDPDPLRDQAELPRPEEFMKGKGYEPPSDLKIGEVTTQGGRYQATVTFRLAGMPHRQTHTLVRRSWRWLMACDGTTRIQVKGHFKSTVAINGVALRPGIDDAALLPGWYEVGLAGDPLLEAKPVAAFVGGLYGGPVELSLGVKPEVRSEIEAHVRKYVDDCAASAELAPVGCPFSASAEGAVRRITWSITSYPMMAYKIDDDSVGLTMWFGTARPGRAEVAGVYADGTPFRGYNDFKVLVEVWAAGGKVVVKARRPER